MNELQLVLVVLPRNLTWYSTKQITRNITFLGAEIYVILNFERHNQIKHDVYFYNNVPIFTTTISFLKQCSNTAHSEYRITLLRRKPH